MISLPKKQQLPAGLVDNSVEFFIHNREIMCLHNGQTYSFDNFPQQVIDIIDADMAQNPKAIKALLDWNIHDENEQMRQYIACRFGAFDSKPDIDTNNIIQTSEYVDCGLRGKCPYEGKLCSSIVVANGILTKKEIEVLRLVAEGYLDKEIVDMMHPEITEATLRSHKDSISAKAGISRKAGMVALAYQHGLMKE